MDIVEKINSIKKKQGTKVLELAEACSVSTTQMSRYLNKKNKMPFDIALWCLRFMDYDLMIILK